MLYKQNLPLGALLILLSELMFASMGATVKTVTAELPSEMAVFMRSLFGLIVLMPLVWSRGLANLQTRVAPLHLLRAAAGVSAMYCFFYALANLPLAEGMLLKMTAPLFMPLIAWLWLSESLRRGVVLAIGLGFAGVILVLDPTGEFNRIALVGLLGGLLAAQAKVTVRRLGRTESSLRVVFYFTLFCTLISLVPALWSWQAPDLLQWSLLILMGVLGTLGQLLMTRGYAIAAASSVSPFTYFSVVFGAIYGYLFWDETLSLHFVIGALMIALAGMLALGSKRLSGAPLVNQSVKS
ncbi:MAG: DMT family transporter [Gammaproteobacteria bacterium]|nr:DMT family transporter [Gammaproteobacteria bacterium]